MMDQTLPALEVDPRGAGRLHCEAGYAGPARICFPFGGGLMGGSHISAVKLIQGLDRTRFTPVIVLHHAEGQFGDFLRAEGLEFTVLPDIHFFGNSRGVPRPAGARGLIGAIRNQWDLVRFLKSHDIRIVHTNEGAMHVSWSLPARLAGAKLLWHHRGTSDARGVRYIAPFTADRIVGVSAFALSEIPPITSAARRTSVVYSPFDTEFEPIDRAEAHHALTSELLVAPETRLIGFFANFVESKRPTMFIDALARIAEQRPNLAFMGLMFGSPLIPGIETQLVERAASLGMANRVRLMGFRYPSDCLMAGCDIHAVPAVGEPFGRSIIEAMLLGTPVVAAASGGNLEAINNGENGLLSSVDDPQSMASAIITLLESPQQSATIAATAMEQASELYGSERHVTQISAIYQSLLIDKQTRSRGP